MDLRLIPDEVDNINSKNDNLINTNSAQTPNYFNKGFIPFNISPQELTDIVNKYKERDENMQDINYFNEKGGIDQLLSELHTDKAYGISSVEGREQHFGTNKVFRKPPPRFCDFVKEALADKMIIIVFITVMFMYIIFDHISY